MSRPENVDELIAVLGRWARIRERLVVTKLRTPDGTVETAAFQCLFELAVGPLRSGELAERLFADPSTVSRHIASLVGLGYVRREADSRDGRATILVLTDSGRRQVEAVRSHRMHGMDSMLGDFSDADIGNLATLMTRFVDAAEQYAGRVDDEYIITVGTHADGPTPTSTDPDNHDTTDDLAARSRHEKASR
ncbi:MarR family winged helix-turn-helix transcriptional regulator [Williamsia sp. M5A3_1d]